MLAPRLDCNFALVLSINPQSYLQKVHLRMSNMSAKRTNCHTLLIRRCQSMLGLPNAMQTAFFTFHDFPGLLFSNTSHSLRLYSLPTHLALIFSCSSRILFTVSPLSAGGRLNCVWSTWCVLLARCAYSTVDQPSPISWTAFFGLFLARRDVCGIFGERLKGAEVSTSVVAKTCEVDRAVDAFYCVSFILVDSFLIWWSGLFFCDYIKQGRESLLIMLYILQDEL